MLPATPLTPKMANRFPISRGVYQLMIKLTIPGHEVDSATPRMNRNANTTYHVLEYNHVCRNEK